MTLANAMVLVDQTAVPLALPQIMRDFSVGTSSVQWVLTASLLPLAGLLVFGGKLGDMIGRRRVCSRARLSSSARPSSAASRRCSRSCWPHASRRAWAVR